MSEFRKDPLSDHWVIIAPNRAERPEQFEASSGRLPGRCPFCRGHEQDTPPASAAYSASGEPIVEGPWQVRVVPNKYPAVEDVGQAQPARRGFYEVLHGVGVHEVIIECPDHVSDFGCLSDADAGLVFRTYRDRLAHWRNDSRLAYGQLFKNSGNAAGASLEHAHSQLIATPVVPTQVQSELERSWAFFQQHGRCVFCEMLEREVAEGTRVVAETAEFVAICPFASQFAYETWIIPKDHASQFEFAKDGELGSLACLVRDLVRRVDCLLKDPGFNYLIHTAPFGSGHLQHYHWHLEFFPRLAKTAGFEWGAGDYINIVAPEQAAAMLRAAGAAGVQRSPE